METIADQLLNEVSRVYREKLTLTDEVLSALHFTFKTPLVQALDLIDKRNVTRLTSPSGRTVFQVVGSSGSPYICLPSSEYCGCQAYKFSVLKREDNLMCKHVLAMKLGVAMGICKEESATNEEIARCLKIMD